MSRYPAVVRHGILSADWSQDQSNLGNLQISRLSLNKARHSSFRQNKESLQELSIPFLGRCVLAVMTLFEEVGPHHVRPARPRQFYISIKEPSLVRSTGFNTWWGCVGSGLVSWNIVVFCDLSVISFSEMESLPARSPLAPDCNSERR